MLGIASCDSWPDSFLTEVFSVSVLRNLAFFHLFSIRETPVFSPPNASQRCPEGQAAVADVPNYATGGVTFLYTEIEEII
jgi:hypothetical protein